MYFTELVYAVGLIWMWFHALMQGQIVKCDFIKSFIRIHQWDWIRKRSPCVFGPLALPQQRPPPRSHFSLICFSWGGVGGFGRRRWNEFAVKMGKNEYYGLVEEYKVKVTLSPPPHLLHLHPSSSPSLFPFLRRPCGTMVPQIICMLAFGSTSHDGA